MYARRRSLRFAVVPGVRQRAARWAPAAAADRAYAHCSQDSNSESAASDLSAMLSIDSISLQDSVSLSASTSAFPLLDSAPASLNNSFTTTNAQACYSAALTQTRVAAACRNHISTLGVPVPSKYPQPAQECGLCMHTRRWPPDHPDASC